MSFGRLRYFSGKERFGIKNKNKVVVMIVMAVIFGIAAGPEIVLEILPKITSKAFVRDESLKVRFFALRG
jgi:hypothetical protein